MAKHKKTHKEYESSKVEKKEVKLAKRIEKDSKELIAMHKKKHRR